MLMSTHTLAVAEEIADRVGVMRNGKVVFEGSVEELRSAIPGAGQSLESLYLALMDGDGEPLGACRSAVDRQCRNVAVARICRLHAAAGRLLPSHEREGQIFWKLRVQMARAHLRFLFTQARLRTSLVIGLSLFFWLGLFALFYKGFDFVVQHVEAPGAAYHAQTMRFVFHAVLSFAAGDADFLVGHHSVRRALSVARDGVPADAAGARRAAGVLPISGSAAVQQLGLLSAGEPDAVGVRPGRRGAVVLLRVSAAADGVVCVHSVLRWGRFFACC